MPLAFGVNVAVIVRPLLRFTDVGEIDQTVSSHAPSRIRSYMPPLPFESVSLQVPLAPMTTLPQSIGLLVILNALARPDHSAITSATKTPSRYSLIRTA